MNYFHPLELKMPNLKLDHYSNGVFCIHRLHRNEDAKADSKPLQIFAITFMW